VALARALAREPDVLLLDEPLAALDAPARVGVRSYLRTLLGELELPTLLVTHDYADAVALAGTVGVLVEGRLRQLGPPAELVAAPADPFVATLTGANVLRGAARRLDGGLTELELASGERVRSADALEGDAAVVVYPWDVTIAREPTDDSAQNHIAGTIGSVVELGNRVRVRVGPLTAEVTPESVERLQLRQGETAYASFKATAAKLIRA
jgi:molybdate transport system ATP-binding protein